jgi:hypothetical protein
MTLGGKTWTSMLMIVVCYALKSGNRSSVHFWKQASKSFLSPISSTAQTLDSERVDVALFLRAERDTDGRRTFRMVEGEPLPTSYDEDLYKEIFEKASAAEAAVPMDG